jgi:NitT/TauT family transport system substrate-binding protein
MRIIRGSRWVAAESSVLLGVAACGGGSDDGGSDTAGASDQDLDKVLLTLNWVPYGEHAPFYYGVEQGFYEAEGIELTVRRGGGSGRTVEAVAGQHTEFGWADTAVLLNGISEGMPVKSAGVFLQKGPASIEFFADDGIDGPEDLKGLTIAGTPGDALYSTFPIWLAIHGMSEDDVTIENVEPAAKVALLAERQVDAIQGFFHDQGPAIEELTGDTVDALLFADFGMNLLGTGVVVHDDTIAENPELVARFMRATVRSWEEAVENPDDAVDSMSRGADATHPTNVLAAQFAHTADLLYTPNTEGGQPGLNDEEDWAETIAFLVDGMGVADEPPSYFWDQSLHPANEGS